MTENYAYKRTRVKGKENVGKVQQDLRAPIMWDEFTAYFYGYVLGDGCLSGPRVCGVHKDGTPYFRSGSIKITSVDEDIMIKLAEELGWTLELGRSNNQLVLHFTSSEWYDFFYNCGLRPRKSTVETHIVIPTGAYFWHFIRGLFDSDGSVMKHHPKIPRVFLGGHPSYMNQINEMLGWYTHFHKPILELWLFEKSKVYKLYHLLYDNATIFMDRKKNKYVELCH